MIKNLLVLFLFGSSIALAQKTHVPDSNFEAYLEANNMGDGTVGNDSVLTANISNINILDASNQNISDLTGIEDFVSLTELYCQDNQLTSLDVTNNTLLEDLRCDDNFLTSLDVTNNSVLEDLRCDENSLTSLDVTNNTLLEDFRCNQNLLTSIDVSTNTQLDHLNCHNNPLSIVDVTNNTNLTRLDCQGTQITALNLSNNTLLARLHCWNTQLAALDLSSNTQLEKLSCHDNQITSLDLSNNTVLNWLDCADNNLSSLNVGNNTDLTYLRCAQNQITSLDLNNNGFLTELRCGNNPIVNLDVTMLVSLRQLFCHHNEISVLDLTKNDTLHTLHCNKNNLVVLDISDCDSLTKLRCDSNSVNTLGLTSLDVANGNNSNFTEFSALGNANLSCILVDDPVWSAVNWPDKPPSADYRVQCNLPGYLPTDSLIAWYPFNGNANDESGNGNDGTVNYGGVSGIDRFGNSNSSLVSIFSDMDVGCGNDPSLQITGDFTLSLWVNPVQYTTSYNSLKTLFSIGGISELEQDNYLFFLSFWGTGGNLIYFHESGAGVDAYEVFNTGLSLSSWHHVVIVRNDAEQKISCYVNGVLYQQNFYINSPTGGTNTAMHMGSDMGWAGTAYDGLLDDVAIWNRVLSQGEISALSQAKLLCGTGNVDIGDTISSCSSVNIDAGNYDSFHWDNGDTTQTISAEQTGYYYVAVVDSMGCSSSDYVYVSIVESELDQSDTSICTIDTLDFSLAYNPTTESCISFNGTSPGAAILNAPELNITGSLSMSLWVKTTSTDSAQYVISKPYNSNAPAYGLYIDGGQVRAIATFADTSFSFGSTPPYIINDGYWHHLAFTIDTAEKVTKLYIDGSLSNLYYDNYISSGPLDAGSDLTLGYDSSISTLSNFNFTGSIDEVSIYNRVLTGLEVGNLALCPQGHNTTGLLGYWDMEEGTGSNNFYDRGLVDTVRMGAVLLATWSADAPSFSCIDNREYLWSTGDTTASISVLPTQTTSYTVSVSDGISSCTDTVTVMVGSVPTVDLLNGADTSIHCNVSSVQLDAGVGYHYQWNTGDTTQIIDADRSGIYSVVVKDPVARCASTDSVQMSILDASIDLGDTTICEGDSVTMGIPMINNMATDIDGNIYTTVVIGDQEWFAENLKTSRYRDGSPIDYPGSNGSIWNANTSGAYAWYDNDSSTYEAGYGKLYNWYAVDNSADLCPTGWHVPSYTEWIELKNYLISNSYNYNGSTTDSVIAKAITDTVGWSTSSVPGAPGNTDFPSYRNKSGFSAIGGGYRHNYDYLDFNVYGLWWSATESDSNEVWQLTIHNDYPTVALHDNEKNFGFSVRCMKNSSTSYLWNNGDTTASITVAPNSTSNYSVTVSDGIGSCSDTVTVTVLSPEVELMGGVDTSGHCNVSSVQVVADSGYHYVWNTGDTTQSIDADQSGMYSVVVQDPVAGCAAEDSVYMSIVNANIEQNDTTICEGDSVTMGLPMINNMATDIDGNVYSTVVIGNQEWFAENLKTSRYRDGALINYPGPDTIFWSADSIGAYAWYNNDSSSYETIYGKLYNWYAVENLAGLCPSGWHVPSDADWTQLENYLISNNFNYDGSTSGNKIAKAMADSIGWIFSSTIGAPGNTDYPSFRNKSGFSGLPGGSRGQNGNFYTNTYGIWQSTTQYNSNDAWARTIYDYISTYRHNYLKNEAFSVRCVKNSSTSYLWNTGDTTASITVAPDSTSNYSVTVSDSIGSCSDMVTVTVLSPEVELMGGMDTSGHCNVSSVQVVADSGYHYAWNTGDTTQSIDVGQSGMYSVVVQDTVAGCTAEDSVYMSLVNGNIVQDDTIICGGDSIVLSADSAMSYLWSTGDTTESITVSPTTTTTYLLEISDRITTCADSVTVTVLNPQVVFGQSTYSQCDSSSVVLDAGAGYDYQWSTGDTTQIVDANATGMYTVTVTEPLAGCTATDSTYVSLLTAGIDAVSTNVCAGDTVLLSNTGMPVLLDGDPNDFTYKGMFNGSHYYYSNMSWTWFEADSLCNANGGHLVTIETQAENDFIQNIASSSTVYIGLYQDTLSPSYAEPYNGWVWVSGDTLGYSNWKLNEPNNANGYEHIAELDGYTGRWNDQTGHNIKHFILEIKSALTFDWSTGDNASSIFVAPTTSTTYGLAVSDGISTCIDSISIDVASLSTAIADASCYGYNDGSISFIMTNGSGNDGSFLFGENDTALSAGSYAYSFTDSALVCTFTDSFTISEPSQILVHASLVSDAICNESTGSASVDSVLNAGVTYSLQWSSGDTTLISDTLSSGIYMVSATDGNGCSGFTSVMINDVGAPSFNTTNIQDVTCAGGGNGSISVDMLGGSPPYTYSWSNGDSTNGISNLTYGPYEVVVTDTSGCTISQSFVVNEPTTLSLKDSSVSAACGTSNGSAMVLVSGGTAPYSYLWSTNDTTNIDTGLTVGVYSVTVTDANGCTDSIDVSLSEDGGANIAIGGYSSPGCGTSSGSIDITPTGGTQPYTYLWSTGDTSQDLSGLSNGQYDITVTGIDGCMGIYSTTLLTELPTTPSICIVTVDQILGTNTIVWEKDNPNVTTSYNLYKESTFAGVYHLIANIPIVDSSFYVDHVSNPQIRSWRYKLTALDSCGNESDMSVEHKTIHLTINLGIGGAINLIWDHYEGITVNTYYVHRYYPLSGWDTLSALPGNLTAYTDTPSTLTDLFYQITVDHPDGCFPGKMGGNHNSSRSNTTSIGNNPFGFPPLADFIASSTQITEGGLVDFGDLSQNNPDDWFWIFDGGTPAFSTQQHPTGILYNTVGSFDVTLVATNPFGVDTILKTDYIEVISGVGITEVNASNGLYIYPNPFTNATTLVFDNEQKLPFELVLIDMLGNKVRHVEGITSSEISVEKRDLSPGVYYVQLRSETIQYRGRLLVE